MAETYECLDCGYRWVPRKTFGTKTTCPKCGSDSVEPIGPAALKKGAKFERYRM